MKEFKCCLPHCLSLCVLSALDEDRRDAALKERGWTVKDGKTYCPQHAPPAEDKPDAEPVPSTG
jgi:hypothetical protein